MPDILDELFSEGLLNEIERIEEQKEKQRRAKSVAVGTMAEDEEGNPVPDEHGNPLPLPPRPYDPMNWIRNRDVIIRGEKGAAWRKAWVDYVQHARDIGLLTPDLIRRMTAKKEDNVSGALGECLAAYSLAKDLNFEIFPGLPGKERRSLEFLARRGETSLHIEVKSPAHYDAKTHSAESSTKRIRRAADSANSQFEEGRANVLVLTPRFQTPVWADEDAMVRALIGQRTRRIFFRDTDGTLLPVEATGFMFDGQMTETHWREGKPRVQFTRISAVISIEEHLEDGQLVRKHVIAHNPAAAVKIDMNLFRPRRQLVHFEDKIRWVPPYPDEADGH